MRLLIAAAAIGLVGVAHAEAPGARRTVAWYASNPMVMMRVLEVCRNDPGHNLRNSDCINAEQAQATVYIRELQRHGGDLTSPESPKYWADRPQERAQKLWFCARMQPEYRHGFFCDAAGYAGP